MSLNEVILSLNTGLNPRQFFKLNTDDAVNYYVTIREIQNHKVVFSEKTDKINDQALKLWILLLLSIFMIAAILLQFIIPDAPIVAWYIDVVIIVWAFPIFLLSRIFRMASYEIDRIKDYNYLFGLFATVTSIISIVIAIIAIVK